MIDQYKFEGGVFSDSIEDGRAGAEIELTRTGVIARTASGKQFEISYDQCQIEIGGFSGHMVFCRPADRKFTIYCEDRKFPKSLSAVSSGLLDAQLDQQRRQRRKNASRNRQYAVIVLVGLLLLAVGAYYGIRAGARAAARAVPVSVDKQIGAMAYKSMDLGGPEIHDPVIVGAIQKIVDRLAPHAAIEGLKFDIHVIESPMVNAFCLPGGTIVVYTGLIDEAGDAEQVAGVIGHEIAHATLRHGMERVSQSLGLTAAVQLILGDVAGLGAAGAELFKFATINSYSRDQEAAADAEGARMLHAAKIDPTALARFFETLKNQEGDLPGVVSWISTHPQHDERIAAVEAQAEALTPQAYVPLDIDWQEVQEHVGDK